MKNLKKLMAVIISISMSFSLMIHISAKEKSKENNNWKLTWSDEFDGTELDETKWTYDIGNGFDDGGTWVQGWGNNEKEYYTEDNATVADGYLTIKGKVEETTDDHGTYEYTSSKIKTEGLFSQKYGRFESRMKLPAGQGLWPAFWLLPQDDIYGGWAASGEIDIMENAGSNPHGFGGTIHYGGQWPNNTYTGKEYEFEEGDDVTDFHTYAVEWEPGEIRWYIDGELFNTINNWKSESDNPEANYSYPAPFDQDFYIILNLAIGGWYDGDPEDNSIFDADMVVDYVRVYESKHYDEATEPEYSPEELPEGEGAKIPLDDGNLVYNNNYDGSNMGIIDSADLYENIYTEGINGIANSDYWYFLEGAGGTGTVSIEDDLAKVDIATGGSENYSIQLIQDISIAAGNYYKVSFDAKAGAAREFAVKVGGDGTDGDPHGWTAYGSNSFSVTDAIDSYEFTFQMTSDTDLDARLEFNLGRDDATVWLGNVKVEAVDPPVLDENAAKEPLADGNHIYNGTFDQGNMNRMTFWNFIVDGGVKAKASVDEETREIEVKMSDSVEASDVQLNQKGLKLVKNSDYVVTFDARAKEARTIEVEIVSEDGTVSYANPQVISLAKDMQAYTFEFTMPGVSDPMGQIQFNLGGDDVKLYIDDVNMIKTSIDYSTVDLYPLLNGDFEDGLDDWVPFVMGWYESWSPSAATFTTTDGALVIDIDNTGFNDWEIQFNQENLNLSEEVTYEVSFDVSSTADREIDVTLENAGYVRYFEATGVNVTGLSTTHTYEFVMPVDDTVSMKFLLGNVAGAGALGSHTITIDNVVCQVKTDITNGAFDSGNTDWTSFVADWIGTTANISVVDEEMKAEIAWEGNEFWNVQIIQGDFTLEDGETYVLVFDARSTVPRDIQPIVEHSTDPFTKYLWETASLTDEMQTFIYDFEMDTTDVNSHLVFALGQIGAPVGSAHDVFIDNVSLIKR